MSCGVPQGSILGPLLFILYINDIENVSDIIKPILFADDTSLFHSHTCFNTLIQEVNIQLHKFSTWFNTNKLSLNTKKTNFIIFTPIGSVRSGYPLEGAAALGFRASIIRSSSGMK